MLPSVKNLTRQRASELFFQPLSEGIRFRRSCCYAVKAYGSHNADRHANCGVGSPQASGLHAVGTPHADGLHAAGNPQDNNARSGGDPQDLGCDHVGCDHVGSQGGGGRRRIDASGKFAAGSAGRAATPAVTTLAPAAAISNPVVSAPVSNTPVQTPSTLIAAQTVPSSVPSLSGFVYVDSYGDGQMDTGDVRIDGAVVVLYSQAGSVLNVAGTCETTTDGSYQFNNLSPGLYTLALLPVSEFIDGKDTPGYFVDASGNPIAVNSATSNTLAASALQALSSQGDDVLGSINLQAGTAGVEFLFGKAGLQPDLVSKRLFLASSPSETYYVVPASAPQFPRFPSRALWPCWPVPRCLPG